jgi:signal peptide peptidase SppA
LARIRRGLEADTLAPVQFSADAESEEEAEMEAKMRRGFFGRRKRAKDRRKVQKVQGKMLANELEFLESLSEILTASQAASLAAVLKPGDGEVPNPGSGAVEVLSAASARERATHTPQTYVLRFFGDVQASQVENLRQEITAVLQQADKERGDEVVLVLDTGGGTVVGYGLAQAQLLRLKSAGLKLTVVVEQVAASGGYLMACTADEILASPYALIGSIGVLGEIPNFYERAKQEGVTFSTITAGKYKRTLTPFKKLDPEDVKKVTQEIEEIFDIFKGTVSENRPGLDIEKVATGEVWLGRDALALGLVDGLTTTDDVLLERVKAGRDVLSVTSSPSLEDKPEGLLRRFLQRAAAADGKAVENLLDATPAWKAAVGPLLADLVSGGELPADRTAAFARKYMM